MRPNPGQLHRFMPRRQRWAEAGGENIWREAAQCKSAVLLSADDGGVSAAAYFVTFLDSVRNADGVVLNWPARQRRLCARPQ